MRVSSAGFFPAAGQEGMDRFLERDRGGGKGGREVLRKRIFGGSPHCTPSTLLDASAAEEIVVPAQWNCRR